MVDLSTELKKKREALAKNAEATRDRARATAQVNGVQAGGLSGDLRRQRDQLSEGLKLALPDIGDNLRRQRDQLSEGLKLALPDIGDDLRRQRNQLSEGLKLSLDGNGASAPDRSAVQQLLGNRVRSGGLPRSTGSSPSASSTSDSRGSRQQPLTTPPTGGPQQQRQSTSTAPSGFGLSSGNGPRRERSFGSLFDDTRGL